MPLCNTSSTTHPITFHSFSPLSTNMVSLLHEALWKMLKWLGRQTDLSRQACSLGAHSQGEDRLVHTHIQIYIYIYECIYKKIPGRCNAITQGLFRGEESCLLLDWWDQIEGSDFSISPTTRLVTYFHVLYLQRPTTPWRHSHPLIFQDPHPTLRAPLLPISGTKKCEFMPFLNTGIGHGWKWTQVCGVLRKQVIYNPLPITFLSNGKSFCKIWPYPGKPPLAPNSPALMILHEDRSHMLNNIPL